MSNNISFPKKTTLLLATLASIASFNPALNAQTQMTKVEGKLIYPSDYLPSLTVCATKVNTNQRYCIKTKSGQSTFSMQIPKGKYIFSSETAQANSLGKAWMTNYNYECGYPCRNNPVNVTLVEVDKSTVKGICPCDWYTQKEKLIFP